MDGILVIDKPHGPTSHDVVAMVRRLLGISKVGHTGTLDPAATGVLPIVLGRATKLARYLSGGIKAYAAVFELGITTRTLDAEGEVVERRPVPNDLDEARVRAILETLTGDLMQVPPMYSAKKVEGQRLYALARKGVEIEREAKPVRVESMRLVEVALPRVAVEVRCSAGTYVRVLAEDFGKQVGCGAHLAELRRLTAEPFQLTEAVPLADLETDPSLAEQHILPMARALVGLPRLQVPVHMSKLIRTGYQLSVADIRSLDAPVFVPDEALALAVDGGEVFAVVRAQLGSADLPCSRRDRRAFKTERVLTLMAP